MEGDLRELSEINNGVESDEEETLHFRKKKLMKLLSPSSTNSYSLRENPKKTWRRIGKDDSQSSETVTEPAIPNKRKRSERKKIRVGIKNRSAIHQELEEVATCLIMLSRDKNKSKNKNKNMFDSDFSDNNNSVFGENPDQNTAKVVILKEIKSTQQFECSICNKMFHSYQALGGHRASHHKKNTTTINLPCPEPGATKRRKRKKDNKGDNHHECPICQRVFQSGQALGGHKRSHLLASEGTTNKGRSRPSVVANPVPEARGLLDLNLPAPIEDEDEEEERFGVRSFKIQPWWINNGVNLEHDAVISLIAN